MQGAWMRRNIFKIGINMGSLEPRTQQKSNPSEQIVRSWDAMIHLVNKEVWKGIGTDTIIKIRLPQYNAKSLDVMIRLVINGQWK
ncbi:MAG: hypothetical protein EZS28_010951 [Streblomastix strix]|uniref:Uncharacterized protein n=1 Tax=Streblomastix strix TaxID=222440 RepID=A0A5J4WEW1_9EUKA|nr:MAG: hypothetical protein EZS28_010951 [Streblomastix strix]